MPTSAITHASSVLVFRCGAILGALPVEDVRETLRPLPVVEIEPAPGFVMGMSMIRGLPTVVINGNRLLSRDGGAISAASSGSRFISLKIPERPVALAVDETLGIRDLPEAAMTALPPLLGAADQGPIEQLARLDGELWMLLSAARLVDGLDNLGISARDMVA
jgi:purine-binding chemotaxis protein CheW